MSAPCLSTHLRNRRFVEGPQSSLATRPAAPGGAHAETAAQVPRRCHTCQLEIPIHPLRILRHVKVGGALGLPSWAFVRVPHFCEAFEFAVALRNRATPVFGRTLPRCRELHGVVGPEEICLVVRGAGVVEGGRTASPRQVFARDATMVQMGLGAEPAREQGARPRNDRTSQRKTTLAMGRIAGVGFLLAKPCSPFPGRLRRRHGGVVGEGERVKSYAVTPWGACAPQPIRVRGRHRFSCMGPAFQ